MLLRQVDYHSWKCSRSPQSERNWPPAKVFSWVARRYFDLHQDLLERQSKQKFGWISNSESYFTKVAFWLGNFQICVAILPRLHGRVDRENRLGTSARSHRIHIERRKIRIKGLQACGETTLALLDGRLRLKDALIFSTSSDTKNSVTYKIWDSLQWFFDLQPGLSVRLNGFDTPRDPQRVKSGAKDEQPIRGFSKDQQGKPSK